MVPTHGTTERSVLQYELKTRQKFKPGNGICFTINVSIQFSLCLHSIHKRLQWICANNSRMR